MMGEATPAPRVPAPTDRRRPESSRSGVLYAGLALVALATAFRVWAIRSAWFFYDDFYFIQQAREGLTASYLVQPYNGHLMPSSWLLTWVNVELGPFDFVFPAVEMMVLFATAGLGALHLFLTLFGRQWGALAPLTLFLFSPVLLPATLWWAAGVNQLPMLVSLTFGLAAFVRHLRDRRGRDLALSLAWLAVGLSFVERSLVTVPILWLVALLYFASGTLPDRIRHLWHTYRRAVVAHAVLLGAYLAAYVPYAMNFDATSITRRPLFGVMWNLAGLALPPGVAGGPLRWHRSDVTQSEADAPQLVLILSWLLVATVVVASVRTRRRGARAWLLPVTVLLVNSVLIATSRAIFFGAQIALDFRFQTELALLVPLALSLAFMSVPGAVESSEPAESSWRIDSRPTVLTCLSIFLVAAVVSTSSFPLRNLSSTSPRTYVENFETAARAHPGRQVLDLPTPDFMWASFAYPTNLTSRMLEPLAHLVDFKASTTDEAWRVDERGRLVRLQLAEARRQRAEADGECFARITGGGRSSWALDGPVVGVQWFVRLAYQATGPTHLTIIVDGTARRVGLEPGRHYLVSPAPGDYRTVQLSLPDGAAPVCLRHLGIVLVGPR